MLNPVLQVNASELASSVNAVWVLTVSFLIFVMQPGFVLLEAGQVRSKNVANIAMKNLFDWSLGVLAFFLVGLGVANAVGAVTSPGGYVLAESFAYVDAPGEWIGWFFGAVFAMTAATIVSGAVAERIRFRSYVVYSVVLTMVIYPVVVGLTWQGGLLAESGYLGAVVGTGYLDFAGGTVVHMVGGVAGLTAAFLLGPRKDRYDENGDSNPIPGHSVLFAVLGTLFLAFGWFGFNVGTQATVLTEDGTFMGAALGRVVLVTTLGMGAGGVASSLVTVVYQSKPDPLFTANGLLAGLVAVTGAAAYVTWWGGLLIGAVGGALVYPTFRWTVDGLGVDDVCGVFAVHGSAGAIGVVLLPFVGVGAGGAWTFLGVRQVGMQLLGVGVIALWSVGATVVVLTVLRVTLGLRVDEDLESAGLDQSEHNIVAYPQFATDGGSVHPEPEPAGSSQGTQEADEPTMWRGEEVDATAGSGGRNVDLDSLPDPAFVVDDGNVVTTLNARALRFFGVAESRAAGAPPLDLVDAAEHSLEATEEVLETGREVRDRRGTVTVDDETVPVAVTATPLETADEGGIGSVLATVRNVADEVATTRHRQTVAEYREEGLAAHREKLDRLSEGTLDLSPGVPRPPSDHDDLEGLEATFRELDEAVLEIADSVAAVVENVPEQSAELADSSTALSQSTTEIQGSIATVSDLAVEIDREVAELSDRTEESSRNVAELSASIEEITASADQIGATSEEATAVTRDCVDEMMHTVDRIRAAAERTTEAAAAIDDLERSMDEVAEITDRIQDIATQTNLLALNASIEAANADADGDGFAVVADEVKALAGDASSAADDIETIVDTAQDRTGTVAAAMDEATGQIRRGADSVERTADDLETVRDAIEETNAGVDEIHDAVDRQARNAQEVSAAMEGFEGTVDDIGALAGEIASLVAAESDEIDGLSGLADDLSEIATRMHEDIDAFELNRSLSEATTAGRAG